MYNAFNRLAKDFGEPVSGTPLFFFRAEPLDLDWWRAHSPKISVDRIDVMHYVVHFDVDTLYLDCRHAFITQGRGHALISWRNYKADHLSHYPLTIDLDLSVWKRHMSVHDQ